MESSKKYLKDLEDCGAPMEQRWMLFHWRENEEFCDYLNRLYGPLFRETAAEIAELTEMPESDNYEIKKHINYLLDYLQKLTGPEGWKLTGSASLCNAHGMNY